MKHTIKIFLIALFSWITCIEANAQTPIPVCPQSASFTGMTRGYYFTAPTNFTICGIYVEDDMSTAFQSAAIVRFTAGPPPAFAGTTNNFVTLWQNLNYVPNNMIPVPNIAINAGDIIGIYGSRTANSVNSYGPANCVINIMGFPTTTFRSGMQFDLAAGPGMHDIWNENNGSIGRVTMYTGCCPAPPAIPAIAGPVAVCEGDAVTYTVPAQAGATTYTWVVPAGATITGGQGTTSLNVTWNTAPGGNICVDFTDACSTSPQTCLAVTVNPIPTVTVPANSTYCNGDLVPAGTFTSTPAGGTFTWTNTNTAIGLAATVTGNAHDFTATNATGSPISGTITVTPTVNGCVGTPSNYTITVNPTPTVTVPANATYCAGDPVPIGSFTSSPAGGTFAWTNTNTAIGLAASGTGNAPAFTATNASGAPISGIITVTPTVNGCVGTPSNYTITVNPTPTVTVPANATYCNGDPVPVGSFTSSPAGGTFTWTNTNTAIGLAASGTGNAPAFTATNATGAPISGTITVTPTVNGCVGTPSNYTITVNPVPTVTVPANATYCAGDPVPVGTFTSAPAGGTFTWVNSDPTIGLAASGTGNAPAFTAANVTGAPITATITITPTVNGCVGTPSNYTITVNPIPAAPTALSVTICPNNTATLVATAPGGTYDWYDAAVAGNLLFTGANYTTPVLIANTNYWVETTVNGCTSPRTMVTVTIAAALTVNAGLDDTICAGDPYTLNVTPNGPGYSYLWDEPANLGFSTLFNPTVNPAATTTYTVTVTDPSNCVGTDMVTITVNPIPTATLPANATYCNGDPVPIGAFTSTPAGGTFAWTNSDPTIGLAASGTGNAPAFTAMNVTGAPIVATVTVTPTLAGCVGTPVIYTITVNPTPTVTVPSNTTYCNGTPVPAGTFTSTPAGGTFTWTNSDPSIGLAASGTGNTPAFNAMNVTGAPVVATVTVTPTVNGCTGLPVNYTITVNPTPTVTVPANLAYCNGDPVPVGAFTSTPAGGTFTWTNSNPSIGLAASGTGNAPAFNAINATGAPIVATITVTPTVNGCAGLPVNYTITVNPGAMANVGANISACPGDVIPSSAFTSTPAGGTFTWSNSNPSVGLATSGVGNTPVFTATNTTGSPITATVSVIATASGCPGVASSYTITVNPIVTGSTNASICQGDSLLIGGVFVSAAGSYLDTLTSSFGCDSILTTNVTVNIVSVATTPIVICDGDSILIEGNYYSSTTSFPFTYTSSFGCDSIVIYDITVAPLPSFNVTGGAFINLGESSNLAVLPGVVGTSYSWTPPDGLSCVFCQNPIATPLVSTWYYVTVTNSSNCSRVDSVYIDVDPSSNIYVPNIFSPNEDGNNDIYFVRGKGVKQFNLAIYNRWGQKVFESDDIQKGWDGTKDGTLMNQGVFVYKLYVILHNGDVFEQTGNITLVR